MKFFDYETTGSRLPYPALIEAVFHIFNEGCEVPRRHIHAVDSSDAASTLLIMPAWQKDKFLGIKHVTIYPENGKKHGLSGLFSTYTLFDAANGMPLAVIDGNQITCRRTAAASALAARYLARKDAETLLICGSGNVAAELAAAYAAVRNIRRVYIWNINENGAQKLAEQLRGQGFAAEAVTDLPRAVGASDIVSCATLSTVPLVLREWVKPGTHIDLIGSFKPEMRESDDALFADTSVFVDTEEALDKSGDLLSPMAAGVFTREQVRADLEDLCRGRHAGRMSDEEITVYKAVGSAAEDLAAAVLVYQNGKD
ncbi:ornithine cyclodeaminase family protein [Neisseria animalis]|uniref:Ornithine cyclodeaminase family protein n=1 Tax=Neisseria animalis TaxID=492 RepID=A0A5P3MRJ9_NEIAN|nr:ornithine cyclodeaminase family protein [Neisseria animalis]QEY24237.1 ornithine cyclodeaminase family protein [Neisseria animalis]ROW32358.1 ornithine cyclodeaminase family protein [Neisseria animalis]VEE06587.1 ornithine cyclodeaminase [Neisseria animalis]